MFRSHSHTTAMGSPASSSNSRIDSTVKVAAVYMSAAEQRFLLLCRAWIEQVIQDKETLLPVTPAGEGRRLIDKINKTVAGFFMAERLATLTSYGEAMAFLKAVFASLPPSYMSAGPHLASQAGTFLGRLAVLAQAEKNDKVELMAVLQGQFEETYADWISLDPKTLLTQPEKLKNHPNTSLYCLVNGLDGLETLDLASSKIGTQGLRSLAEALPYNKTLHSLNLANNAINVEGMGYLVTALKGNKTLGMLGLRDNDLDDKTIEVLAELLKCETGLSALDLGSNKITAAGAEYLAFGLTNNTKLMRLYLSGNKLGDEGAKMLAAVLHSNKTLQVLHVGYNVITSLGAGYLAEGLTKNVGLIELNVDYNYLDDQGTIALAKALTPHLTLTTLSLQDNCIYGAGAKALASMLTTNSTLISLELGGTAMQGHNMIGQEGAQAFQDMLENNYGVVYLDLGSSHGGRYDPDNHNIMGIFHHTINTMVSYLSRNCREAFVKTLTLQQRAYVAAKNSNADMGLLPADLRAGLDTWYADLCSEQTTWLSQLKYVPKNVTKTTEQGLFASAPGPATTSLSSVTDTPVAESSLSARV